MIKIPIRDSLFSHAFSTSNWFKPSSFEWDFKSTPNKVVVLTDNDLYRVNDFKNIKKYAWLVESCAVTPHSYSYVLNNYDKFDAIFSHHEKVLKLPNSYLVPIGGCHLLDNEISLNHKKNKLVSMMYSNKNFAPGHSLRFLIANNLGEHIDVMGSGKGGVNIKKALSCVDYMFSVAIENCKVDYYFTEKIIDCFLSGVIPIYWGCPSIGDFFNKEGILCFNSVEDLKQIISDKNFLVEFYNSKKSVIEENFRKALKHKVGEDFMFDNYKDLLCV